MSRITTTAILVLCGLTTSPAHAVAIDWVPVGNPGNANDSNGRGTAVTKNEGAVFYIPTENEWYKAAFYSPLLNSGSGGYYSYATRSNADPGNVLNSVSNQVNSNNGVYSVTQSPGYSPSTEATTTVVMIATMASCR